MTIADNHIQIMKPITASSSRGIGKQAIYRDQAAIAGNGADSP
jgi:hypothetical protein